MAEEGGTKKGSTHPMGALDVEDPTIAKMKKGDKEHHGWGCVALKDKHKSKVDKILQFYQEKGLKVNRSV